MHRVCIKGAPAEEAVLCTKDTTYSLRQLDTRYSALELNRAHSALILTEVVANSNCHLLLPPKTREVQSMFTGYLGTPLSTFNLSLHAAHSLLPRQSCMKCCPELVCCPLYSENAPTREKRPRRRRRRWASRQRKRRRREGSTHGKPW